MQEGTPSRGTRLLVVAAAAVLLLAGLGTLDLWAPDEPRYGQVAEEMRSMVHGLRGLVVLHLNGEAYTQKPPLYYWLAALAGAPGGCVTELAARLPSALAGIAAVWITVRMGAATVGVAGGLWGGAILLSTSLFVHLARRAQLDVLLTLLEAAALFAFWRLLRGTEKRRANIFLLHGALGLAVLTKGPVGVLVPVLAILATLGWTGHLRRAREFFPAWGLALSLGPGLAWAAAAVTLTPRGYAAQALGTNIIGRFFQGTSHPRPFYYFLYQFPVDFLPWTLLWPLVFRVGRSEVFARDPDAARRDAWRFLLSWVGASFVFFSISSGKRGLYMLPCFPAAALLCGDALARTLAGRRALPPAFTRIGAALAAIASGGAAWTLAAGQVQGIALPPRFGITVLLTVIVMLAAWMRLARTDAPAERRMALLVAGAIALEFAIFVLLFPAFDRVKSSRPIATAAAALTPPGRSVGLLGDIPMVGALVYYGGRPVAYLSTGEDARRYLDGGGTALVTQARRMPEVRSGTPLGVVATFERGKRSFVVLAPARPGSGPAAR